MGQADWDFESVDWTLDESVYHDASPSLLGTDAPVALVLDATSGALSNGRLIFWARTTSVNSLPTVFFRNQVADGGADKADAYRLDIYGAAAGIRFSYYTGGGAIQVIDTKTHSWVFSIDTWYRLRVTWWHSVDRIYVRVEYWTGSAWATFGGNADTDFEDTNDRWKDNAVNRCGFLPYSAYYIDDVEVWG